MSKVIRRARFDTNDDHRQWIATAGGRIVKAMPDEYSDNFVDLYFEVDQELFNRGEFLDRAFLQVSTGEVIPTNYEFVATVHMTATRVHHIYQYVDPVAYRTEHTVAVVDSFHVRVIQHGSKQELVLDGTATINGLRGLMLLYSQKAESQIEEFLEKLKVVGLGVAREQVVNGQVYSTTITKES